jgi:hypothetical protein
VLVGQALITANLCARCGEGLKCSVVTGERCAPQDKDAHFHEEASLYGGSADPVCCVCLRAAGKTCTQTEANGAL